MSSLGVKPSPPMKPAQDEDDDWETDPDFLVHEKESRWGAKTVAGSGHQQESISLDKLREDMLKSDKLEKRKLAQMPKASDGYGGKFGVQRDRVDQCAVGFEYQGKVEAHASQRDYSHGFGGTFGVQSDRQDKSALGWDSRDTLEKHESQKDYKMGFGGQFGVQSDRKDKSAADWSEREQAAKHESQTDYKKGFGGQFGVQTDRKDKSALGWDEVEKVKPHESQTDYKKGFGGQFGVQSDRKDKSAHGWEEREKLQSHESQTDYKKGFGGQFGVHSDRKDKSALGWEKHEKVEKHESQMDYKKGFGGQFGIQSDRQDKSAFGWDEKQNSAGPEATKMPKPAEAPAQTQPKSDGAKSLRNKFEQMAMQGDKQNLDRARGERERRKREDEQLRQRQEEAEGQRQQLLEAQWAKQSEQNDGAEGGEGGEDEQQQRQQPKQRPTIGVRLPYATAAAALPEQQRHSRPAEEHPIESDSTTVAGTAEVQLPPIKVLPTSAENALHKMMAMGGGGLTTATHDETKKYIPLIPKAEMAEEENVHDELRDSAEWADETPSTDQQVGGVHVEQRQGTPPITHHYNHQYELPPTVDDGTDANVHSETDQNVTPPSDPMPTMVAAPSEQVAANVPPITSSPGTSAVALFEYERQDDDEIGFEVNDIINDIEQIDVGWWRGVCKGRLGLFPANYVQLIERK